MHTSIQYLREFEHERDDNPNADRIPTYCVEMFLPIPTIVGIKNSYEHDH